MTHITREQAARVLLTMTESELRTWIARIGQLLDERRSVGFAIRQATTETHNAREVAA